mmetsp:Transcript_38141/g.77863  ORF Transcript_38141/g.77863 Transcript_38141/m.77863 type:complete len:226 (-) Transcript_38141:104-781(-)
MPPPITKILLLLFSISRSQATQQFLPPIIPMMIPISLFLLLLTLAASSHAYERDELLRAKNWFPRPEFTHAGNPEDESHQSMLNRIMVEAGINIVSCNKWSVKDLLYFQEMVLELREPDFEEVYQDTTDPRRSTEEEETAIRHIQILSSNGEDITDENSHDEYEARRDEKCALSAMWFIHSLDNETRRKLIEENVKVPSVPESPALGTGSGMKRHRRLCGACHVR